MKQPRPVLVQTWLDLERDRKVPYYVNQRAYNAIMMHFDSLEDARAFVDGAKPAPGSVSWLLKKLA